MEGITTLIHEVIFGLCLFFLIPTLTAGLSLRQARPEKKTLWAGLLALSALLCLLAGRVLVTLPVFDFVDRCRPPGTGMCVDGRSYEAVRWEILGEQALILFAWLFLPLGLGVGALGWLLQKFSRRRATDVL